jgi:hypothetical protein
MVDPTQVEDRIFCQTHSMKTDSLYVIAQRFLYSNIQILSDKIYGTKEEAESEKEEVLQEYREMQLGAGKLTVMSLADYIQEYGSDRYDEGVSEGVDSQRAFGSD